MIFLCVWLSEWVWPHQYRRCHHEKIAGFEGALPSLSLPPWFPSPSSQRFPNCQRKPPGFVWSCRPPAVNNQTVSNSPQLPRRRKLAYSQADKPLLCILLSEACDETPWKRNENVPQALRRFVFCPAPKFVIVHLGLIKARSANFRERLSFQFVSEYQADSLPKRPHFNLQSWAKGAKGLLSGSFLAQKSRWRISNILG